jgi:hypothetical protein
MRTGYDTDQRTRADLREAIRPAKKQPVRILRFGDTHDLNRMPIDRNRLAENVGAPAIFSPPEAIAQNRAPGTAAPVIIGRQSSAQHRLYAQRLEILPRYIATMHRARFASRGEIKTPATVGKDPRKYVLPITEMLPGRIVPAKCNSVCPTSPGAILQDGTPAGISGLPRKSS